MVIEKGNIQFERNGVKFKITPHTFRYTFATLLLDAGESISNVQRYLGHSERNYDKTLCTLDSREQTDFILIYF